MGRPISTETEKTVTALAENLKINDSYLHIAANLGVIAMLFAKLLDKIDRQEIMNRGK